MNSIAKDEIKQLLLGFRTLGFWLVVAGLAGLACGLVGTAFSRTLAWVTEARAARPWLLYFLPAAGLVIVWSYKTAGMENDSGTNQIIASVRGETRPPLRLAFLIFLGTALTHLTGGSAGREGAALQIGGSLTVTLGKLLRLKERNLNLIVMCGMSGLFTALFGTPVAATLFSMEVVGVGKLHYSALFPCLLTSLTSLTVTRLLHVESEAYTLLGVPELGWPNLLRVGLLAMLCALLSILFCVSIHQATHLYRRFISNQYLRVLVGGALVIILTRLEGSGDYNGAGSPVIDLALEGEVRVPWAFLLKLLFTALTLGAGFRGGEIVPTFFVGATFGCAVAPLLGLDPAFGAAIGMIALFCGVVNCPLASVFLSLELFGGGALLFFAFACTLSFLLSGNFSLYSAQKIVYSKLEPRYVDESAW